jgi:hypothetical protein
MQNYARKAAVSLFAGAVLAAGALTPASAQPIITGGLVNVVVFDVIENVTVQDINVSLGAALGIAANVCDVNVNVLATQLRNDEVTCESEAGDQTVTISQI